ncbi:MAG: hypothetical protein R3C01_14785 [Planctomycetaceae bacterium]
MHCASVSGTESMPYQPLRIAVTMLSIGIGLTIALATSGSLLSIQSSDFVAQQSGMEKEATGPSTATASGNAAPNSPAEIEASTPYPPAEIRTASNPDTYRPLPIPVIGADETPLLRDVVADLPHGRVDGRYLRASNSQGAVGRDSSFPRRLGYEELPAPEDQLNSQPLMTIARGETGPVTLSPRIDTTDNSRQSSPFPLATTTATTTTSDDYRELQAQIVSLRAELQQSTQAGLSRELVEIQRLRDLLHELQSLRQLSDLQAEVHRLAERQASLESVVDEQEKPTPPPTTGVANGGIAEELPAPAPSAKPMAPLTTPPVDKPNPPNTETTTPPVTRSSDSVSHGDSTESANESTDVPQIVLPERVLLEAVPRQPGQWNLRLRGAHVAEVLDRLCEEGHWNAAVGPGVDGEVNMTLSGVSLELALQNVARAVGCEVLEEGNLRMLVPADVAEARRRAARQPIAKVIPLSHIAAIDVAPLVAPLLTPQLGEVGITTPSAGPEHLHGPRRAIPDAIVVVDYGDAVAQIESLVAELDVPPPEVEIDAVILRVRHNEKVPLGVMAALKNVCQPVDMLDRAIRHQTLQNSVPCAGVECVPYRGSAQKLKRSLELLAATDVAATPRIRVLNRQTAEISVGENVGYRTHAAWRPNGRSKEQDVEMLEAITRLKVTPFVHPDGSIRVQVHPHHSHVVIDPKTDLPRQQTASAFTDVTLTDGCTLVIGGLMSHTEEFVSKDRGAFGLIKRQFRKGRGDEYDEEIVILLTTHLVTPPYYSSTIEPEFAPAAFPASQSTQPLLPVGFVNNHGPTTGRPETPGILPITGFGIAERMSATQLMTVEEFPATSPPELLPGRSKPGRIGPERDMAERGDVRRPHLPRAAAARRNTPAPPPPSAPPILAPRSFPASNAIPAPPPPPPASEDATTGKIQQVSHTMIEETPATQSAGAKSLRSVVGSNGHPLRTDNVSPAPGALDAESATWGTESHHAPRALRPSPPPPVTNIPGSFPLTRPRGSSR